MDAKIDTASQEFSVLNDGKPESPMSREIFYELTENVEGIEAGSSAIDPKTGTTKRKRDKLRKYEVDQANTKLSLASPTSVILPQFSQNSSVKRLRGRPKGSGKLQLLATIGGYFAVTAGGNFHPHAVIVSPGEDIVGKIISFAMPKRAVCVLSAIGMVARVLIYQPASSSEVVSTFERSFEILSLSGLYTYHSKLRVEGSLTISLAKPDGQVFGGIVGGPIIAENPIQLIVATFKQNVMLDYNKKKKKKLLSKETSSTPVNRLRLGDSENMVRDLTDIAYGGADTAVTAENENEDALLVSQSKISEDDDLENHDVGEGENDSKDSQTISDKKTSSDSVAVENENVSDPAN